jgi:hypothetical protein
MSRYRLKPRISHVTPEGSARPLEVLEIGEEGTSSTRTLAIANPSQRPDDDRWSDRKRIAVALGSGPWPVWILVYCERYEGIETACEIAIDYAIDRWPGLDATPSAEDLRAALDDEGINPDTATDEERWSAHDTLTEGCMSDGSGRYAEVPAIEEIPDRAALIRFLYPDGPRVHRTWPDTAIQDRHADAVAAMCRGLASLALRADLLAREGEILASLDEATARHMAG